MMNIEPLRPTAEDYTVDEIIELAESESARLRQAQEEDRKYWSDQAIWWNEHNRWLEANDKKPLELRHLETISGDMAR